MDVFLIIYRPSEHWLDVALIQIQPALCVQKALKLFCDYILKNYDVQRLLSYNLLVLRQLRFQLLNPFKLVKFHTRILALPGIKRWLTNAIFPAYIIHLLSQFLFLQDNKNLTLTEFCLFHLFPILVVLTLF